MGTGRLVTFTFLALPFAVQLAAAQSDTTRFAGLDRNNDGVITRDEWRGSRESFVVQDWNGDGVLSGAEVRTGSSADGAFGQEQQQPQQRPGQARRPVERFVDFDVNRDNRITTNEWTGTRRGFELQDTNRDGVISRREFREASQELGDAQATPGSVGTSGRTAGATAGQIVRMNLQQPWTDTGLMVNVGDLISFDAEGNATLSTSDASDVATPAGARSGRRAPDAPLADQPAGAVIARIGDSTPFFVGTRRQISAPVSGRLFLGINDDHLPDNSGEYRVNVVVRGY